MKPSMEFWVVEFNGAPQVGHSDHYYAGEYAEDNFGDALDVNGNKYRLVRYVPAEHQ
jgi:hypothetical protein